MRTVLLVDDDSIFHFISSKTLQRMNLGFQVHSVFNGQEAIDFVSDSGNPIPDVILLDLNMPVMDGFAFLKAFHESNVQHKDQIKIIVLSSSKNSSDMDSAQILGAHHYLAKPLEESSFKELLGVA